MTHQVKAICDIEGVATKGDLFDIEIHWSLGGMINCTLADGRRIELRDSRLENPQIEPVRSYP